MKRILVIGEHSYIGTSLQNYIQKNDSGMQTVLAGARDGGWKQEDLSRYDVVFLAAGKAHADVGNVSEEVKREYYRVNYKLAVEAAKAAKAAGVRQFIYPSSIIIYGESAPAGRRKVITKDTKPLPDNFYGDSKRKADLALQNMNGKDFKTAVLRLPMVYGKGSRGNYPLLAKLAKKLPFFPAVKNERSMIYIDNLCEFIREIIENEDGGVFYPQNAEYTKTAEMVRLIAGASGKKIHLSILLSPFVRIAGMLPGKIGKLVTKAFGNCVYEKSLSQYRGNRYQRYSLKESIRRTERQM